jgi:hypothetical protein
MRSTPAAALLPDPESFSLMVRVAQFESPLTDTSLVQRLVEHVSGPTLAMDCGSALSMQLWWGCLYLQLLQASNEREHEFRDGGGPVHVATAQWSVRCLARCSATLLQLCATMTTPQLCDTDATSAAAHH